MKKIIGLYALLGLVACLSFAFGTTASNQDDFWQDAARSNMAEVMLSNVALQKAQSADVKAFAQMMVDDHTRTGDELKTLAAGKNVTLPTDMDAKHKAAMDKLNNLSTADFDRQYMKLMVSDHEKAVKLFQKQADRGTDADLKAFAAKTLPALQTHLERARTLSASLKGSNSGNTRNTNGNSNKNSDMNMNSNGNSDSNRNSNSKSNRNTNSKGNTNSNQTTNSNTNDNRQ